MLEVCSIIASNFLKLKLPELVRSHIEAGMSLVCVCACCVVLCYERLIIDVIN